MKATIRESVRYQVEMNTDRWVSVADLRAQMTNVTASSIARALRQLKPYLECMLIPGDRYGRKQWAVAKDNKTGWKNADPFVAAPRAPRSRKKTKAASASAGAATQSSYGGFNLMCAPANKPSLIKAVGDLVTQVLLPAQTKFSAHDVTKKLRWKLLEEAKAVDPNNRATFVPTVDPAETGTVHVQGVNIPKVDHDDVKNIVHELYHQGALVGYERVHNGQYFEYDLVANIAVPIPTVVSADPDTGPTGPVATVPDPAGTDGGSYDGSSTI